MSAPSTIGRLRIERQLGAGGFATVWQAYDPELDAPVAVKILAENFAAHADVRRRFIDEARLLRRVDSDHLVRVYDVGELPDGRPFFVMTYADGGTLADHLAVTPPPWPLHSVLGVVDALADGLAVLHRHGVVHRDVKPVNVLLRAAPEGGTRVLLGDLGIAKDLQWASGLTMPGGSSGYAAPEQEGYSEQIGPPTDVHALAVTAGQLMGLYQPWPAGPVGAVLAAATHPDPRRRTASPTEFAAQLREVLGQNATTAFTAPGPAVTPAARATPSTPAAPAAPAAPDLEPLPGAPLLDPGAPTPNSIAGPTPNSITAAPSPLPSSTPSPSSRPPATPPPMTTPMTTPMRTPMTAAAARPGRRGLLAAAGAAGLVAVLALGGVGWWATHRTDRLTPPHRKVSVAVPTSLSDRTGAAFPAGGTGGTGGTGNPDDGLRASDGRRSVAVAYRDAFSDPAAVLDGIVPATCSPAGTRTVTVGAWTGRTRQWTGCADGTEVAEVVLADDSADGWTVWVEVRSVGGDPDLADVLGSLEVRPRG